MVVAKVRQLQQSQDGPRAHKRLLQAADDARYCRRKHPAVTRRRHLGASVHRPDGDAPERQRRQDATVLHPGGTGSSAGATGTTACCGTATAGQAVASDVTEQAVGAAARCLQVEVTGSGLGRRRDTRDGVTSTTTTSTTAAAANCTRDEWADQPADVPQVRGGDVPERRAPTKVQMTPKFQRYGCKVEQRRRHRH